MPNSRRALCITAWTDSSRYRRAYIVHSRCSLDSYIDRQTDRHTDTLGHINSVVSVIGCIHSFIGCAPL